MIGAGFTHTTQAQEKKKSKLADGYAELVEHRTAVWKVAESKLRPDQHSGSLNNRGGHLTSLVFSDKDYKPKVPSPKLPMFITLTDVEEAIPYSQRVEHGVPGIVHGFPSAVYHGREGKRSEVYLCEELYVQLLTIHGHCPFNV